MNISELLSSIDSEIARLRQARSLLAGLQGGAPTAPAKKPAKRRKLSAKARKAIGDAQRKRWAKVKAKKAGKKTPAKKAVVKKATKAKKAVTKKIAPAKTETASS